MRKTTPALLAVVLVQLGCGEDAPRDFLVGCPAGSLPACGGDAEACALFDRINCERRVHDRTEYECDQPLTWDDAAAATAAELGAELARRGDLEHDGWGRQNLSIASSADEAMDGMMTGLDEPHCTGPGTLSHHCNIMHCDSSSLGVAAVRGRWHGDSYWFYVMNFH